MKLHHVAAACGIALAGVSASAAALPPLDLSSGSTGFANTPIVGAFIDTATFTVTTLSVLTGSVTSVVNGNQDVDFSSISITGPSGTFNFNLINPDPFEFWVTTNPGFVLGAGSYTLTLTGVNSAGAGSYAGNIAVSPVPEPQALALLCAGLGVVGFLAGRRKK